MSPNYNTDEIIVACAIYVNLHVAYWKISTYYVCFNIPNLR